MVSNLRRILLGLILRADNCLNLTRTLQFTLDNDDDPLKKARMDLRAARFGTSQTKMKHRLNISINETMYSVSLQRMSQSFQLFVSSSVLFHLKKRTIGLVQFLQFFIVSSWLCQSIMYRTVRMFCTKIFWLHFFYFFFF